MIIAKLKGGLGNQMYQYAFGLHLAIKNNTELKLDLSYLNNRTPKKFFQFRDYELDLFNIKAEIAGIRDLEPFKLPTPGFFEKRKIIKQQNRIKEFESEKHYILFEPHFHFYPKALRYPKNTYIDGYWQSEKYFKGVEDIIRRDFQFNNELEGKTAEFADKISLSNSVCLHVRHGYLNNLRDKYVHGFVGMRYIKNAIEIIKNKIENPELYVFSDNPDWCKANIKTDIPVHFVENEIMDEKNHIYFQLMTLCRHYIIANSSFSWWGAWLSNNPNKVVIAPKKWFRFSLNNTKDLIPEKWLRV
ncbi:alpha-1,2-fucosyltransferase [Bacteroidota bacterium]